MKKSSCVCACLLASILVGCGGGSDPAPALPAQEQKGYIVPAFEETTPVRDATGREVDWGSRGAQLNERVFTNDIDALAEMFRKDEGAVLCQGAAYYLHLKYLKAGYRSYLIGFQSDYDSHAVALVEVRRTDGSKALIVQDPTFNLTYVDSAGQPLSIFELLTALAQRHPETIVVQEGLPAEVEYLWADGDPAPIAGEAYITSSVGGPSDNPLFESYPSTVTVAEYNRTLENQIRAYTEANGLPNNPLYLMFDRLLYVYKGYPMTEKDKEEADAVFDQVESYMEKLAAAHSAAAG